MKRYLIPLFVLFLIVGCQSHQSSSFQPGTQAAAQPSWYSPKDTLTVVTWNMEHFVDPYDNPYIHNKREDQPPANMPERRELFVKAVKALDADIVVFEEFESDSYLRSLADEHFPEMGYQVFTALESPDWYMNVVMMSRVPVGLFHSYANAVTPIVGLTDDQGDPAQQVLTNNRMWTAEMLVDSDVTLWLTGLHLKAGRGERNEAWRRGQINLLRDHLGDLTTVDPQRKMLVVGDLNMTPDEDEFKLLLGDQSDQPTFVDPLAGSGVFSHPSDSLFWRIDHWLPNQQLQPNVAPNSVHIAHPLPMEQMIKLSDHLPVAGTLAF
jgi:endonuclease/exonuclease/phosphatase family metal-dependent hydrolase